MKTHLVNILVAVIILFFGMLAYIAIAGCHFDSLQIHYHKHYPDKTDTVTVDIEPVDPDAPLAPWETP